MKETDLVELELHCPYCQAKIVTAKSREDLEPGIGAFMVCPCGNVGVLADRSMSGRAWHVRKPTPDERKVIFSHPEVGFIRDCHRRQVPALS